MLLALKNALHHYASSPVWIPKAANFDHHIFIFPHVLLWLHPMHYHYLKKYDKILILTGLQTIQGQKQGLTISLWP